MFNRDNIRKIATLLKARRQTIAVAESVTAGFLQAALASGEAASAYFQGGITAYNLNQKYRHLHVDILHALPCNCVSAKVAAEMAVAVAPLFESNWGIGITGYATPVPGHNMEQLFAYYAISFIDLVIENDRIILAIDEPVKVQLNYVDEVLQRLEQVLQKPQGKRSDD